MAKKIFDSKGRIDSLLSGEYEEKENKSQIGNKSFNKYLKQTNVVISLSIDSNLMDKVKAIAYLEREYIKNILNKAIFKEVENYEKLNGVIKEIPRKQN